jgi:hypothetical protein
MRAQRIFLEAKQRERIEDRAGKETDWFFRVMGGRVPEPGVGPAYARPAAEAIVRWLRSIPAFHRGALSLLYETRAWPEALTNEFGMWTSLVVRLECARLADGSGLLGAKLEKLAAERIEEDIAARQRRRDAVAGTQKSDAALTRLERSVRRRGDRADRHVELACRAYAKARGNAPCVLPRGPSVEDGTVDDADLAAGGAE